MNSTKFKVEVIFGDVISKDFVSPEQITKLNIFFGKKNMNININFKFNFLNLERKQILIINRVFLLIIQIFNS